MLRCKIKLFWIYLNLSYLSGRLLLKVICIVWMFDNCERILSEFKRYSIYIC